MSHVVVMGGGIMGLLTMVLARRRGAARLILSDPLEERRQLARKLGARVVVDPTRESLPERVMALTGGRGAEGVGGLARRCREVRIHDHLNSRDGAVPTRHG